MTTSVVHLSKATLSERIDRSLVLLHALPGLDARVLARSIGAPALMVVATHWVHQRSPVRSSLARIRLEEAERLLRRDRSALPAAVVVERTAETVGFRSVDEMDRAFLRLRHRSSFDVLLASRAAARSAAA